MLWLQFQSLHLLEQTVFTNLILTYVVNWTKLKKKKKSGVDHIQIRLSVSIVKVVEISTHWPYTISK